MHTTEHGVKVRKKIKIRLTATTFHANIHEYVPHSEV